MVYPNPADNFVAVKLPTQSKIINAQLIAVSGAVIELNFNENQTISLPQVSTGLYILKVQTAENVYTSKLSIK